MKVVWRVGASNILHVINGWPLGFDAQPHAGIFRRSSTLFKVAGRTGRCDIIPPGPAPEPSGDHMVKCQFPPVTGDETTILTSKPVPQKQVKTGEAGIGAGGDIFFQGYDTGQPDFRRRGMNHLVIFLDDNHPVQINRLDHILPTPQR